MAAELPSASDPNHKPAAPAAATNRRVPWATMGILVFLALNLALCVRRVQDDRGAVAFVGVSHLNLALLFCALRFFEVAPEGSPARGCARLAVWLLTTTLTAAFTWKIVGVLPLGLAIAALVATVDDHLHRRTAAEAPKEDAAAEPENERLRRRVWELRAAHRPGSA